MQRLRLVNLYCQRNGYTLFELLLIAAILVGMAFIQFERSTNVSHSVHALSVHRLESEVRATTNLIYSQCHLHPDCDVSLAGQRVTMDGQDYSLNYGWLDAGDNLRDSQIGAYVDTKVLALNWLTIEPPDFCVLVRLTHLIVQ